MTCLHYSYNAAFSDDDQSDDDNSDDDDSDDDVI